MVVMPKGAPHEKNGYAYMNYLLTPQVIANISNSIHSLTPTLRRTPMLLRR
jgi:spermidine/putrescine-binding protein